MIYHFIYWIIIVVLAFAAWYYREKIKVERDKKKVWQASYNDAKDAWASQSNAVREKGIECDQLEKENKRLEKKYNDIYKLVG